MHQSRILTPLFDCLSMARAGRRRAALRAGGGACGATIKVRTERQSRVLPHIWCRLGIHGRSEEVHKVEVATDAVIRPWLKLSARWFRLSFRLSRCVLRPTGLCLSRGRGRGNRAVRVAVARAGVFTAITRADWLICRGRAGSSKSSFMRGGFAVAMLNVRGGSSRSVFPPR